MFVPTCECDNPNQVFVVLIDTELDPDRIGILVRVDGRATNRWADGIAGIGCERARAAEEEVEAACPVCGALALWRDGGGTEDGAK